MTGRLAKTRFLSIVMASIGLYILDGGQLQAASVIQDCGGPNGICEANADCSASCADEQLEPTTCGEWGEFNGETCDIDSCAHNCQDLPSAAECYISGALTTCGTYGTYRTCGDDYCSRSPINWEGCGGAEECEVDCGVCPDPMPEPACDKSNPLDSACGSDFCNGTGACCEGYVVGNCASCDNDESCTGIPAGQQTSYYCIKKGANCNGT